VTLPGLLGFIRLSKPDSAFLLSHDHEVGELEFELALGTL
jgi:hypothetical protein